MSTLPAPLSADFSLLPGFLSAADADAAFNAVLEETQWEVHHFKLFGKIIEMPRRIAYAGHKAYSYSGVLHSATPMTAMVSALCAQVSQQTKVPYNVVLINLYRNGQDSMGWHADDDYECGAYPQVASLSLGVERRFAVRRRTGDRDRHRFNLPHGSLLIMQSKAQIRWQHELPKMKAVKQPRINLTFRHMT